MQESNEEQKELFHLIREYKLSELILIKKKKELANENNKFNPPFLIFNCYFNCITKKKFKYLSHNSPSLLLANNTPITANS